MATAEDYARWIVANPDKKGTPEFDTVAKAYQAAKSSAAPAAAAEDPTSLRNLAGAGVEPILHLASGALAAPISGLAGAGTAINNALGFSDKKPADVVRSTSEMMTYQPRTQGGKTATEAITYPLQKYAEAADLAGGKTTDLTGSPAAGAIVNALLQAMPAVAGAKVAPKRAAMSSDVADAIQSRRNRSEVRDETLAEGMDMGLKVPPSVVNPSAINKVVESIAGKAALRQELQQRNQPIVNEAAATELGLPPDTALTVEKLGDYRYKTAEPYRDVAALSKTAASALESLKQARHDASEQSTFYQRSADPAVKKRAEKLSAEAEVYEQIIADEAKRLGRSDLLPKLAEARKKIAQSYDIQDGLNRGSGNVSSPTLGAAYDNGAPLTGRLETIAKFQQAMKPYMGEADSVTTPGVNNLAPAEVAALAMGGHAAGGGGILAGGIPILGGPARALALSEPYQRLMAQPGHGNLNRIPSVAELMIEEIARRKNAALTGGAAVAGEH